MNEVKNDESACSEAEQLQPVVITERHVMAYRKKLLDYVKKEQPDTSEFGYNTYLLDMLYFMGIAIDEDRFRTAQGFNEFKKLIKKEL